MAAQMNRYEQELCKIVQVICFAHGCPQPSLTMLERCMRHLQDALRIVVGRAGRPDSERARQVLRAYIMLHLNEIPAYQHPSLPVRRMADIERAFDVLGLRTADFLPHARRLPQLHLPAPAPAPGPSPSQPGVVQSEKQPPAPPAPAQPQWAAYWPPR